MMNPPARSRPTRAVLALILCGTILGPLMGLPATPADPRDAWQRPQQVMDSLGIALGHVVADIGAGRGYFTLHLARRVGPWGRVYAVDIDPRALAILRRRVRAAGLANVVIIRGAPDDPRLPQNTLDVALIVNAYHEFRHPDAMLRALFRALKPRGKLAIIDGAIPSGHDRSYYLRRHRIPRSWVRRDAERNGFVFFREEPGFLRPRDGRRFYFLIFTRPPMDRDPEDRPASPDRGSAQGPSNPWEPRVRARTGHSSSQRNAPWSRM